MNNRLGEPYNGSGCCDFCRKDRPNSRLHNMNHYFSSDTLKKRISRLFSTGEHKSTKYVLEELKFGILSDRYPDKCMCTYCVSSLSNDTRKVTEKILSKLRYKKYDDLVLNPQPYFSETTKCYIESEDHALAAREGLTLDIKEWAEINKDMDSMYVREINYRLSKRKYISVSTLHDINYFLFKKNIDVYDKFIDKHSIDTDIDRDREIEYSEYVMAKKRLFWERGLLRNISLIESFLSQIFEENLQSKQRRTTKEKVREIA